MFAGSEALLLDTLRWGGDGLHLGHGQRASPREAREVYDLFAAGERRRGRAQAALTEARRFLEGYPLIPALKAIMRERTGDDVWRNLRPPLDALSDEQARELGQGTHVRV